MSGKNLATRTRVMLVEDQTDFRDLMALLLRRESDFEVVAQAGSLAEARGQAATVPFDVAVLDLGLPDGNGVELIDHLRQARDGVSVLVLSAGLDSNNLAKAAEAGADEILDKFAAPSEVVGAIRRCTSGHPPTQEDG